MSHHVHAATGSGGVMECWSNGVMIFSSVQHSKTPSLHYSFTFSFECGLDFSERQAIHDVIFSKPAFAGDADPEPQILQAYCAVGIRIDHTFDVFLFRQWPPTPVEIEPLGGGVEFNPCAGARCSVEHRRNIDLVRLAFQKQTASRMRQH